MCFVPWAMGRTTRWGWTRRGCRSKATASQQRCRPAPAAATLASSLPRRLWTASAMPLVRLYRNCVPPHFDILCWFRRNYIYMPTMWLVLGAITSGRSTALLCSSSASSGGQLTGSTLHQVIATGFDNAVVVAQAAQCCRQAPSTRPASSWNTRSSAFFSCSNLYRWLRRSA